MRSIIALVAVALLTNLQPLSADDAEKLQGTWVCDQVPLTIEVTGSTARMTWSIFGSGAITTWFATEEVDFRLQPEMSPKRFDPDPDSWKEIAGRHGLPARNLRLVYKLEEDKWTLALGEGEYPPSMEEKEGVSVGTFRKLNAVQQNENAKLEGIWQGEGSWQATPMGAKSPLAKCVIAIQPGWCTGFFRKDREEPWVRWARMEFNPAADPKRVDLFFAFAAGAGELTKPLAGVYGRKGDDLQVAINLTDTMIVPPKSATEGHFTLHLSQVAAGGGEGWAAAAHKAFASLAPQLFTLDALQGAWLMKSRVDGTMQRGKVPAKHAIETWTFKKDVVTIEFDTKRKPEEYGFRIDPGGTGISLFAAASPEVILREIKGSMRLDRLDLAVQPKRNPWLEGGWAKRQYEFERVRP